MAVVSSCREMVKSRNERNPCELLPPAFGPSTLFRLPCETGRKVGMTSSQHGLYVQGCTRTTMLSTERTDAARRRKSQKLSPIRIAGCNSPA